MRSPASPDAERPTNGSADAGRHSVPRALLRRSTRFGPLRVAFDDRVLHPRPWTLMQSDWAVELLADLPSGPVLEVCCGAGQIGQVVAARTGRHLTQVDASEPACRYAVDNARRNGLKHLVGVRCMTVANHHDLAVAAPVPPVMGILDPPYLPSAECRRFPSDPRGAIDGGPDGLHPARLLVAALAAVVVPCGVILVQLRGTQQVDDLTEDGPCGLVCAGIRSHDPERAVALLVRPGAGLAEASPGR